MKNINTSLCIIGAGAAGLSVAAIACQLDIDTTIIERHKLGGDCLHYGCIPSKSLLSISKHIYELRNSKKYANILNEPKIDYSYIKNYINNVIQKIEPHDSIERFEKLGAKVIIGEASFVNKNTITVNDTQITAKKIVICTGSKPSIPEISGLQGTPYLTNESVFSINEAPESIAILGGGPTGVEIAQAFNRLGVQVHLLVRSRILSSEDHEQSYLLASKLAEEGIAIHTDISVTRVNYRNLFEIFCKEQEITKTIKTTHFLIATGRVPSLHKLQLSNAAIEFDEQGIKVDKHLRTTNPKIYAAGDVTPHPKFTHMASYQAGVIIKNILFKIPAKYSSKIVPRVTFTEPEFAQVGMIEREIQHKYRQYKELKYSFSDNDRAQTEDAIVGNIKVFTSKRGKILGVSILGPHAGELITPWVLAISNNFNIKKMAEIIIPYPTLSEVNKNVSSQFFAKKLFSILSKKLVKLLF